MIIGAAVNQYGGKVGDLLSLNSKETFLKVTTGQLEPFPAVMG